MRPLIISVFVAVLMSSACLAQGPNRETYLVEMAHMYDVMMELEVAKALAPLQLTEPQVQSLLAVYEEYPFEPPDLQKMQAEVSKLRQVRDQLVSGALPELKPEDEIALMRAAMNAFASIAGRMPDFDKPDAELSQQERLLWEILTPEQQGKLVSGMLMGAQPEMGADEGIQVVREMDEEAWGKARDGLLDVLSAGAGDAGTPARQNSRQMLLDFFTRVRAITPQDFAEKQDELAAELEATVPPGTNLGTALAAIALGAAEAPGAPGHDQLSIRMALWRSLLNPHAPVLVQEIQAARAKAAGQ